MHSDFSYLLKTHPFPSLQGSLYQTHVFVFWFVTQFYQGFLLNFYEIINGHKTENNNSFSPESTRSQ